MRAIHQGRAGYVVTEAIVHTLATPTDWWVGKTDEEIIQSLVEWHVQGNGWRAPGYHRLIHPDGHVIHQGLRSLWEVGAHVRGHNRGTVGICLIPVRTVPDVMRSGARFEDYYTEEQRAALRGYLRELAELTPLQKVSGHNEYAPKSCPGFIVSTEDWLDG